MNISGLEACNADLFTDIGDLRKKYSKDTVDKVVRVRAMYVYMVESPSTSDADIVREFTARYGVSRPTAYSDLAIVKVMLPNLSKNSKDFNTWRATEMFLKSFRVAEEKKDAAAMARVAADFAKTFRVGEAEQLAFSPDDLLPQHFIPVDDPSVLGIKPMPDRDKRIKELLEELSAKDPQILNVEFEEADVIPDNDVNGNEEGIL